MNYKTLKILKAYLLIGICLLFFSTVNWAEETEELGMAIIVNGCAMLPAYSIASLFEANVEYKAGQIKIVKKPEKTIVMRIGSRKALVNNTEVKLEAAPLLYESSVYSPLRFLVQALGGSLKIEPTSHKMIVSTGKREGYCFTPAEPIPLKYSYNTLMEIIRRQEKKGDEARNANRLEEALWHYKTALEAASTISYKEMENNPLLDARRLMRFAGEQLSLSSSLAVGGVYDLSGLFGSLAQENLLEVQEKIRAAKASGKFHLYQAAMERFDKAVAIQDRLKGKNS